MATRKRTAARPPVTTQVPETYWNPDTGGQRVVAPGQPAPAMPQLTADDFAGTAGEEETPDAASAQIGAAQSIAYLKDMTEVGKPEGETALRNLDIAAPGFYRYNIGRTGKSYYLYQGVPITVIARYMRLQQTIQEKGGASLDELEGVMAQALKIFQFNPAYAGWTVEEFGEELFLEEVMEIITDFFASRTGSLTK